MKKKKRNKMLAKTFASELWREIIAPKPELKNKLEKQYFACVTNGGSQTFSSRGRSSVSLHNVSAVPTLLTTQNNDAGTWAFRHNCRRCFVCTVEITKTRKTLGRARTDCTLNYAFTTSTVRARWLLRAGRHLFRCCSIFSDVWLSTRFNFSDVWVIKIRFQSRLQLK